MVCLDETIREIVSVQSRELKYVSSLQVGLQFGLNIMIGEQTKVIRLNLLHNVTPSFLVRQLLRFSDRMLFFKSLHILAQFYCFLTRHLL